MSGFKGFTNDSDKDGNVRFEIDTSEVTKLVKKYKKLKKFQKSNIAELSKLSGIETEVDEESFGSPRKVERENEERC